jgi:hypothetical protein
MLNGNPGLSTTEAEQAEGGSIGASSSQGAKPALGTSYNQPAQEAFANLPHLSPVLAALVELYDMLRNSDAPLWLFDKVVAFIEKHNGRTFCRHKTIPHWEALLKELHWSFSVPRAKGIPVAMETGNEALAPEGYECLPRHSVVVQRWPILSVLQEYFLDLRLFGNKHNLVNAHNPFGKYESPNEASDKELLAGRCYNRTYDTKISDPSKEFLLVLELYLDKTGRTAALGL